MKNYLLLLTVFVLSYTNAQNTLIVDKNPFIDDTPDHVFTTINAAMAAASNGDTIYIQPASSSYGAFSVTKSVTILGLGYAPDLNNGETSQTGNISVSANNVKISGLNVTGWISPTANITNLLVEDCYIFSGVYVSGGNNSNITFRGNVIRDRIQLNTDYTQSVNVTITNNLIQNLSNFALYYFNDTTIFNNNVVIADQALTGYVIFNVPNNVVCQNNIWLFTNNALATVDQNTGSIPVIHNNSMTYHYGSPTITPLNGSGNLDNQNPFFVNIPANNPYWTATNDYNLGNSSTGNNAGTDGNDVGIFNGFYDFDIQGYPTELPYLTEMSISNNMVQAGADLNVNLKANANKSN